MAEDKTEEEVRNYDQLIYNIYYNLWIASTGFDGKNGENVPEGLSLDELKNSYKYMITKNEYISPSVPNGYVHIGHWNKVIVKEFK